MSATRYPMEMIEQARKHAKQNKVNVYVYHDGMKFVQSTRGQPSKYRSHWRLDENGNLGTYTKPAKVTEKTAIVYK